MRGFIFGALIGQLVRRRGRKDGRCVIRGMHLRRCVGRIWAIHQHGVAHARFPFVGQRAGSPRQFQPTEVPRDHFQHVRLRPGDRINLHGDRTRVEVNIEGRGGGLANSINLRQMTPKILQRLKESFDKA